MAKHKRNKVITIPQMSAVLETEHSQQSYTMLIIFCVVVSVFPLHYRCPNNKQSPLVCLVFFVVLI